MIIPAKVDEEGEVVSHHLHHKTTRRWKRDAEDVPMEKVHYHLEVNCVHLHCMMQRFIHKQITHSNKFKV